MNTPANSSPKVKHKHDVCHHYLKKENITLMHEQT